MNDRYIVIYNHSNNLDQWIPVLFLVSREEALAETKKPLRRMTRGDLLAIIPAEQVSNVIPSLEGLRVYDGQRMLEVPPSPDQYTWLAKNWVGLFESEYLLVTVLWQYYATFDSHDSMKILLECICPVQNLLSTVPPAKRLIQCVEDDLENSGIEVAIEAELKSLDQFIQGKAQTETQRVVSNVAYSLLEIRRGNTATIDHFFGNLCALYEIQSTSGTNGTQESILLARTIKPKFNFHESMVHLAERNVLE